MKIKSKSEVILLIAFALYSLIHGICLVFKGDDFFWFRMDSFTENFGRTSHNGRYFTNIITYIMCNYDIWRVVIYFVTMILLFWVLNKLVESDTNHKTQLTLFVVLGIFGVPSQIFTYTFSWISGFTNYVIGTVLSLLYIFYCFPILKGNRLEKSRLWALFTLVLGFVGAMCVENLTIYNVLFAIFIIIFVAVQFKSVHISNITYLIGALVGVYFMFTNVNYSDIFVDEVDNIGNRFVMFSLPDIFMKIFTDIIPYYSKMFYFPNIIIGITVLYFYIRKFKINAEVKPPKYAPLFTGVISVYCLYSLFTRFFENLLVLSPSYRIRAIETAFVFIYLVAIVYMAYILFDKFTFIRVVLYILSTLIVTAPFLVVNPVTFRCFFSDYIFWFLVAGEFFVQFIKTLGDFGISFLRYTATISTAVCLSMHTYFNICNKYCDNLRIEFLRQQVEENRSVIQIIELPYVTYAHDFIDIFSDVVEITDYDNPTILEKYVLYYFDYVGIDRKAVDLSKISYISMLDYYVAQES